MFLPTLLTTSAFALAASAFLIPAEVANAAIEATKAVDNPVVNDIDPTNLNLTDIALGLPCTNCPYALASERNGKHEWINGVPNALLLILTTENKHLTLNNVPVYPFTKEITAPPSAKQVKQGDAAEVVALDKQFGQGYHGELTLSYSFEVMQVKPVEATEIKVLEAKFQVLAIDSEMVEVPVVIIEVHKQPDGELTIASLALGPSTLSDGGKQCTTIFCRIVADMISKVQAAKAKGAHVCQKVKACLCKFRLPAGFSKRPPPPSGTHSDSAKPHHGSHHPESHHHHMGHGPHHHHRHHALHRILHGIKRVFKHFVLPVMVGIAAGMAACALGMLVGQVGVFLWMRVRGKGAYAKVEQAQEYEKEGLMTEEGLPKYEEVEAVIVMDEKEVV